MTARSPIRSHLIPPCEETTQHGARRLSSSTQRNVFICLEPPLQPVQDLVEPDLEAGFAGHPRPVLPDVLHQVRHLGLDGRDQLLHRITRALVARAVVDHLQRVAEHVPVEQVVRVVRDVRAEAALAQVHEGLVDVPQPRDAGQGSVQSAAPRVPQERVVQGDADRTECRAPVVDAGREVDLRPDEVGHAVQNVILIGYVIVERHGFDAEARAEGSHAQRFDAALVGEVDGGGEHARAGEGGACGHRNLLEVLTA